MMEKIKNFFLRFKVHVYVVFILILALWGLHNMMHKHIIAEFTELAPFSRNMPVYYKGFKVGKSIIKHKNSFDLIFYDEKKI